jgi:hypothetical protein
MMRTAKIKVGEHLHCLEAKEDSEEVFENIIEAFPSALSHGNYLGRLPIHSAVCGDLSSSTRCWRNFGPNSTSAEKINAVDSC